MALGLLYLPQEILDHISSELPNSALKNLRLLCRSANYRFRLRFHRVFLSPSEPDIDVFVKVAKSETFRHQIVELIWDLSQFCKGTGYPLNLRSMIYLRRPIVREMSMTHARQKRFVKAGHLKAPEDSLSLFDDQMTIDSYIKYHLHLQTTRRRIESSGEDALVLLRNIKRFTSLRRITISHATHGWLCEPLYETPLIRSFPSGFKYDILRHDRTGREAERGYEVIFEALAVIRGLNIEELVIETNGLPCGLHAGFFYKPIDKYQHFVELLSRPQFRRLDLALVTSQETGEYPQWDSLDKRLLVESLRAAKSLTHFSFKKDCHPIKNEGDHMVESGFVPLQSFLPVDSWLNLRHFGLSHVVVNQDDLVTLLGVLPRTVRSVELGFLLFTLEGGNYAGLLEDIRSKLCWDKRNEKMRPRLVISLPIGASAPVGMAIRVDAEIQCFLYSQGTNPFRGFWEPYGVEFGIGMERDAFNPGFEWPHDGLFSWREEVKQMDRRSSYLRRIFSKARVAIDFGVLREKFMGGIGETEDDDAEESDPEDDDWHSWAFDPRESWI